MGGQIAVWNSHVVEEGVGPQEFLDVLIHVLGIGLEEIAFGVECFGEELERHVVVGGGVEGLVDCARIVGEGGVVLLELQELAEVRRQWQGHDAEDDYLVLLGLVTRPHLAVDVLAVELSLAVGNDIVL